MNTKRIIEIALIVVFIIGTALVLFSNKSAQVDVLTTTDEQVADAVGAKKDILPYGNDLKFDGLHSYNPTSRYFSYPQVTPQTEVGIQPDDLIKPHAVQ